MTTIEKYYETIWPAIGAAIPTLQLTRKNVSVSENHAGVNFAIVIGSACFMEGVLETSLRALLEFYRDRYFKIDIKQFDLRCTMNHYYWRIESRIDDEIGRTTGTTGFDQMFELFLGEPLHALPHVAPLWEAMTCLFSFRNVLGHGRQVTVSRTRGPFTRGQWEEDFTGGYAKADSYLRKTGLLSETFFDKHSDYIYLSDAIADYFWDIASAIPNTVVSSLEGEKMNVIKVAIENRGAI